MGTPSVQTLPRQVTTQLPGNCDPTNAASHSGVLHQGREKRLEANTTHSRLSPRTEQAHTSPPMQEGHGVDGRPAAGQGGRPTSAVSAAPRRGPLGNEGPQPSTAPLTKPLAGSTHFLSHPPWTGGMWGRLREAPAPQQGDMGSQAAGHPAWPGAQPGPADVRAQAGRAPGVLERS